MAEQGDFIIQGLLGGLKDKFTAVIDWLKELPGKFKEFFVEAKDKIVEVFSNIGGWFTEKFELAVDGIKGAFASVGEFFSGVWDGIKEAFGNISGWFSDKFSAAWQAVKDVFSKGGEVFSGIKDSILDSLKSVINTLIEGINNVITIPFDGINTALRKIRDLQIGPWTPFDWISEISTPQIPYLASGAAIPPNAPFAAVLGDQKRGYNIEAPEGLIRKIFNEELDKRGNGNGGVINLTLDLDGNVVFRRIIEIGKNQQRMTGLDPFALA